MTFSFNSKTAVAAALLTGFLAAPMLHAQGDRDRYDRYDKNGRYDDHTRLSEIEAGTYITVRTQLAIDTDRPNARFFPAVVQDDVWDDYRRLSVPVIQRGSPAQLSVRTARDGDLILDLDSLSVGGQRYAVSAANERVESREVRGNGNDTATNVAGGAIIGSIIGAIAGGGKGAAVGAVAGAAVGVGMSTHGRYVRVPAGSVLTFRLDRPLTIAVKTMTRR